MKLAIPALALAALLAAGCQQQNKSATQPTSLDLTAPSPTAAPMAAPVAYAPPLAPVQTALPDPTISASVAPAAGNSYTVKPGDTLWKIASSHYGDGKKWHQIADANPGLTPSKLKVGQTITLP